jgi:hypothetical protein
MRATNLRANGEVSRKRRLADNEQELGPWNAPDSRALQGPHGVVEDGMVRKWCELSRESLSEAELEFMVAVGRPKSRRWQAVRAPIVAKKRGNARGAKGRRWREAR